MAADEFADPSGGVTTQPPDSGPGASAVARKYTPEDFRLHLDGPLFKRDNTHVSSEVPQLRQIVWDSVAKSESPERVFEPVALDAMAFDPTPVEIDRPMVSAVVEAPQDDGVNRLALLPDTDVVDDEEPVELPAIVVSDPDLVPSDAALLVAAAEVAPEPVAEVAAATVAPEPVAEVAEVAAVAAVVAPEQVVQRAAEPEPQPQPQPEPQPAVQPAPVAQPAIPLLSQSPTYAPKARVVTKPVSLFEDSRPVAPRSRKRKRGVLRRMFSLVIVLGLIGGGLYAAKRYVLDAPKWAKAVEPYADEVAAIRGLGFKEPVVVVPLPVNDYAARLATTMLGLGAVDREMLAGEWRAVGLLNGELDSQAIGLAAVPDTPAFYDPATKEVYVVDMLTAADRADLYAFAVERALTVALLDQHFRWSERLVGASPSEALAVRAVVDADALAVAREAYGLESETPIEEALATSAGGLAGSPSPWASAVVGRPGLGLLPMVNSMSVRQRATLLEQPATNDGAVFDAARGLAATANVGLSAAATSRGMIYWYHALAARIGSSAAWAAALTWTGDNIAVNDRSGSVCVTATVAVGDALGGSVLKAAFDQWALAAPPESLAKVTMTDETHMKVESCDPGSAIPTGDNSAVLVFGGAAVEQVVVALGRAGVTNLSDQAQTCLVNWARFRGSDLAWPMDMPPLLEPSAGWPAPYVESHTPTAADIEACRA